MIVPMVFRYKIYSFTMLWCMLLLATMQRDKVVQQIVKLCSRPWTSKYEGYTTNICLSEHLHLLQLLNLSTTYPQLLLVFLWNQIRLVPGQAYDTTNSKKKIKPSTQQARFPPAEVCSCKVKKKPTYGNVLGPREKNSSKEQFGKRLKGCFVI